MWQAIIKVVLRLVKSKISSSIKIIGQYKKIKKGWKLIRNFKVQKQILLEEIKRQKEILLKGSFKEKVKEFASNTFLAKFFKYQDIQNDITKSDYDKQKAKVDFAFEFPLLRRYKVLKTIFKQYLRLQKQYQDLLNKQEQWLLKKENKWSEKVQKSIEIEQEKILKQMEKNKKLLDKTIKTLPKQENNKNQLNRKEDINTFLDFNNTLFKEEQDLMKDEIFNKSGEMEVVFNSSWIDAGIFIPHFKQKYYSGQINKENEKKILNSNTRGFMKLKLKKGSKMNSSGVYVWWNVKYNDWKKIINIKTGKNFWEVWYKKNRKNMMYLLPNSKYWRSVKPYKSRKKKNKAKN